MNRTKVRTVRYRVGKNHFLVIHVHQYASAASSEGNTVATNALNIKIAKHRGSSR